MTMSARVVPYFLFAVFYWFTDFFPVADIWGIIGAYLLTGVALLVYRDSYNEFHIRHLSMRKWAVGIIAGLIGIIIWIVPYHFWPSFRFTDNIFGLLGEARTPFGPERFASRELATAFYALRAIGYIFITPVFEELFIRSFLMRYLIHSRFINVPIGYYSRLSFWGTATFFSLTHPEWIVAFCYAVLLNYLICKVKSLSVCVIAHGTSNAILVFYVLFSGHWELW
jgi:uncharacterized protein